MPLASPVVRGLINLRGQIVTALDGCIEGWISRIARPDQSPSKAERRCANRTMGPSVCW